MIKSFFLVYSLFSRKQKFFFVIICTLIFLVTLLELFSLGLIIPLITSITSVNFLDNNFISVLKNIFPDHTRKQMIFYILGFFCIVYILKSLISFLTVYAQFYWAHSVQQFFRNKIFINILNKDYKFFLKNNSAKLLSKIINHVDTFTTYFLMPIMFIILEGIIIISVTILLFFYEPLIMFCISIFLLIFANYYFSFAGRQLTIYGDSWKKNDEESIKYIQQTFEGIKENILFQRQNFYIKKVDLHTSATSKALSLYLAIQQAPRILLELVSVITLTFLIFFSIIKSDTDYDHIIIKIALFAAAAFKILPSLNRFIYSLQSLKFSKNIINILTKDLAVKNNKVNFFAKKKKIILFNNKIEIKNVSFSYSENITKELVLKNINLNILKGEKIGIIGKTGSGKSTFFDLFSGLLKPQKGTILVDGLSIYKNINSWHNSIAYVPQTAFFLEDSIKNNIIFYDKKPDQNYLNLVLKITELKNFIKKKRKGLEEFIGERGTQISGGQKQRISIARALYKKSKILILDESTSALDEKTQKKVLKNIFNYKDLTVIFISHNKNALKFCDKIYEMKDKSLFLISTDNKKNKTNLM
jgi:ABC-type multidrug transport system fused ATPase/permease subunit